MEYIYIYFSSLTETPKIVSSIPVWSPVTECCHKVTGPNRVTVDDGRTDYSGDLNGTQSWIFNISSGLIWPPLPCGNWVVRENNLWDLQSVSQSKTRDSEIRDNVCTSGLSSYMTLLSYLDKVIRTWGPTRGTVKSSSYERSTFIEIPSSTGFSSEESSSRRVRLESSFPV